MSGELTSSLHYIVAATPRSGSTLLCELLKGTGVAGQPNEDFQALRSTGRARQPRQYFEGFDAPFIEKLAPTDPGRLESPDEFRAKLAASKERSTTLNGVYGTKVMWGFFDDLIAHLATLPGLEGASRNDALAATFPGLRFVQIQRADKVGQAISLWTAVQTLSWRDEGDGKHDGAFHAVEPFYDFDAIDHLVRLQTEHEDAWTAWLDDQDAFPVFRVSYEALAEAPQDRVRDVIDWLDVPGGAEAEVPAPKMRKQSNGRSKEWADRYREERAARSAGAGAAGRQA